jgi:hypothetical protein
MRLTQSLPQFEESEEALSPATLNDSLNAFLDSPEQGRFEEHFVATLWIYDSFQGGLLGGDATWLISLLSAPVGEAFALTSITCLMAPSQAGSPHLPLSRILPPLRPISSFLPGFHCANPHRTRTHHQKPIPEVPVKCLLRR